MADLGDTLNEWLLSRALRDCDLSETLRLLSNRLIDGGVPVSRVVVGRALAHPVIGLANLVWERDSNSVHADVTPPGQGTIEEIRKAPFGHMTLNNIPRMVADLTDKQQVARFALFAQLATQGATGYAAFSRSFDDPDAPLPDDPNQFKGAVISFVTRRFSGFSAHDIDLLERIWTALCVCIRVAIDRMLVTEISQMYLGRISGHHVLTGQSRRGDRQNIDCVLLCSDLRNSLRLGQTLPPDQYLDLLNHYFDCTAGAVLDHGGEVLKFIGDGILAIFPFDDETRPRANMCSAALSAAQEAFARALAFNTNDQPRDPLDFGIALHVGEVIYGNVGTEKRLDFTATGPAVGLVTRCEALTRTLPNRLLATAEFATCCPEGAEPLGSHDLRGFTDPISLVSYPTVNHASQESDVPTVPYKR